MQVGESTLKTLIEGQKQFQVPLYQRQYSWGDSQRSQLWDDILEQYDLITPDEAGAVDQSAPTHFLGSVVLAPSPMIQAHGVTSFLVIDGQQRLTTLLIALCALRDRRLSSAGLHADRARSPGPPSATSTLRPTRRSSMSRWRLSLRS